MNLVRTKTKIKISNNNNLERHPVPILGINYKVRITYKNIKITQLYVENKIIKISLPNRYKKIDNKEILDLAINKMYEQIAKIEIERAMEKTRIMVGFAPEEYEIKEIENLGKCEKNKITINPKVVKYNREVIDYIVLHQYCHLKHKKHTKTFFKMLEKYQPNYQKSEEILLNL